MPGTRVFLPTSIGLLTAAALAILFPLRASAGELLADVTVRSGIRHRLVNGAIGKKHLPETMLGGAAWLDFDGDGLLDLYLVNGHSDSAAAFLPGKEGNVLWRNRGDGTFEDVTERAGVGDRHYGFGAAVGDIDNDGDPDLYVANFGPNVLYRNDGDGTFTDITAEAGVSCPIWSTSAAFADIDGDGLLDLYVANYLAYDPRVHGACTGNAKKLPGYCHPNKFDGVPDCLFRNLGGNRFTDISRSAGIAVAGRILSKGLGVLPTDFDGDGRIDFFIANDSTPNFLWRNLGDLRFEDAALEAGVALDSEGRPEACMGIDGTDVDGDGLIDYVVINFSEETDTLYLGEGEGFFLDGTARAGLAPATYRPLGFGCGFLDHDLDGDLDLFVARGHVFDNIEVVNPGSTITWRQPDQLFENDGAGVFTDVSASAGSWFGRAHVGRAAAFADYDNDGDLDIYIVNTDAPSVLLEGRPPPGRHWVGIALRGGGPCNRDAYGSRVELVVSGREKPVPLEIRSAWSYLSANDPRRVVGLGADGRPERARVRWADGLVEVFTDLRRDAYNVLVRGTGTKAQR